MQLRSSRLATLLAVTALTLGALTACAPEPEPDLAPSWTASATPEVAEPLFASDEEALAAAEAAYAAYLTEGSKIMARGDGDVSSLTRLVAPSYLEEATSGFIALASEGRYAAGLATYDTLSLMRQDMREDGSGEVQIYVCQDISGVKQFDSAGNEVIVAGRQNRLPLVILLVPSSSTDGGVLVGGSEVWRGDNFC